MAERTDEIFNELSQILEQYKAEVPSDRRAWPESVKMRVFELRSLGMSFVKIAERTGIAVQTLYTWKRPESFLPVAIVDTPMTAATPTVSVREVVKRRRSKAPTVTVTTPSGYRIEGLDAKSAAEFLARIEGQ